MTARALVLALCLFWLPAQASPEFRFRIPEGFRDLSPGVPAESFDGLPDTIRTETQSGKYAAFGMDVSDEDGFYENFNAVVQTGALRVTEDFASEHKAKLLEEYPKLLGGPVSIVEHGIGSLGGIPVVRVVFDVKSPDLSMRQLQYLVPGGNEQWAILTYAATSSTFDRYRPLFEASAAATVGAREAKLVDFGRAGMWGVYGAGIGSLVGLILQLSKKRQKAAKPAPQRMPTRTKTNVGRPPRPLGRR